MKKILCLLSLFIILSLAACSGQAQVSGVAFGPPVKDVYWGMTPEEVMESLSLPEECIQSDNGMVVILQCEDRKVFGQNADIEMIFDIQANVGMLEMRISFEDFSREQLVEELNKAYGNYCGIDNEGKPCQWESEKIEDMPEEIQDRIRYIKVEYPAQYSQQEGFSGETVWNALKSQPLITVTLGDNILNYNAQNMAGYLICSDDDAYEAMQDYLKDSMGR